MTRPVCPYCGSSTGYGTYICFKCGAKTGKHTFTEGFLANFKPLKELLAIDSSVILNPKNFPAKALQWLYDKGIYDETIVLQNIGYVVTSGRLLIPAFNEDNVLMFYQLRSIEHELGNTVKYYSKGELNTYTIHYNDFQEELMNNFVVIVEDHISAMRIRKFYNVVALSTTKLRSEFCEELVAKYSTFIFWLDPDEPGQTDTQKNYLELKYYSEKQAYRDLFRTNSSKNYSFYKVRCDTINKDPKWYLNSEIENIIKSEVVECEF